MHLLGLSYLLIKPGLLVSNVNVGSDLYAAFDSFNAYPDYAGASLKHFWGPGPLQNQDFQAAFRKVAANPIWSKL